jgi:hypothetical protein
MTTTPETATCVIGHTGAEDCIDYPSGCRACYEDDPDASAAEGDPDAEDDPDATLHAYFASYGCGPKAATARTEGGAVARTLRIRTTKNLDFCLTIQRWH